MDELELQTKEVLEGKTPVTMNIFPFQVCITRMHADMQCEHTHAEEPEVYAMEVSMHLCGDLSLDTCTMCPGA